MPLVERALAELIETVLADQIVEDIGRPALRYLAASGGVVPRGET